MLFETTKTLKRILYIDPIKSNDITELETFFYEEGVLVGRALYSYSFDDINWSDYNTSRDTVILLEGEETHSLTTYLRILLCVDVKPNTTFSAAQYNCVGIEEIKVNGIPVGICGIEYFKDVNLVRNDDNSNRYNPYRGINDSHHLREQLSESIIDTFGIQSTYFLRVPQESTKSIIWKSYKLHNTLDPKEIKVMLSIDDDYNGDVQSYQYYADYENMEVEITKETWHTTFGADILPSPKDCLYITLFEKMFRVVQVKEDRNFMNKAVAYKFYLGKHIEGVEIDNGSSQEVIDDFTEFLAYDLENSEQALDEVENATGIQDTVEFTKEDRDTIEHNSNSSMVDYSKGMENVETKLKYLGNIFQRYMYYDPRGVEFLTKYDVSKYDGGKYTIQLWAKILSVGTSVKVMRLETDGIANENIYVNANGYLAANIKTDNYNKYITATGTPMKEGGFYGISFSRMGQTIILNVVEHLDGDVKSIQEIVTTGVKRPVPNKIFTILADKNIMSGNIRFGKKPLSKSRNIIDITKYQPDANDYIVVDNNNPTVSGLKVSNTY